MKKNDLIIILASTLIFVIIWIGFNIYHNSVSSTISPSINTQLSPIAPIFNTKAIDELKKREKITPVFQSSIPVPLVSPSEVLQNISSESAQQATSGGSLLQ